MRSLTKTMFYLLITVSIMAGLFAGCADNPQTATSQPPATSSTAKPSSDSSGDSTATSETSGDGLFNPVGLPITNEPYTLDILHVRNQGQGDDYQYSTWFEQLEKDTNVKPDWITYWNTDWPEKKSIMFASGDLPSVIFGANGMTDLDILPNLSYFIPLNDLIDQYMPNLLTAFEIEPDFKTACTFLDGNIYTLPKRLPARPQVSFQPFINKTWLDNLGLAIPDTLDELYEALKAFKDGDPKGDGSLVVPFTGSAGNAFFTESQITTLHGARANGEGLAVRNGVVTFVPMTEEWKSGMEYLRNMFADGLMDNEYFTQDGTMATGKKQNIEQPMVGLDFGWTPGASFGPWVEQYITLTPPANADGKRFSTYLDNNVMRNEFEITIYCEYPEIAARWADQFYTFDAAVQNFWGPFDGHCMEDRDGIWTVLPPTPEENIDFRSWWYSPRDYGPKFLPLDYENYGVKLDIFPGDGDGLKLSIADIGHPYVEETFPRLCYYTIEQTEELNSYRADIRALVGTMGAKWISSGGMDDEWDIYLDQLKGVGIERWLEIHQEAYDAYTL